MNVKTQQQWKESETLNFFQVNIRSSITFVDLVLKLFLTKVCLYIKAYQYSFANAIKFIEMKASIGTKWSEHWYEMV